MAYIEERTIVPAEYHSPAALMFRRVVYFALNILEVLLALRLVFRAFGLIASIIGVYTVRTPRQDSSDLSMI